MKRETAVEINQLVENMISLANDILYIANNSYDAANRGRLQAALGKAVTELDLEILEPIYVEFPDLRPPNLEEIKS